MYFSFDMLDSHLEEWDAPIDLQHRHIQVRIAIDGHAWNEQSAQKQEEE
jgi:hypothetical protein